MEWRNKLIWIIISVVFLGMVYLSYSYGTTKPSQKVLDTFVKKYESIIAEKDKTINRLDSLLLKTQEDDKIIIDQLKKQIDDKDLIIESLKAQLEKKSGFIGFDSLKGFFKKSN